MKRKKKLAVPVYILILIAILLAIIIYSMLAPSIYKIDLASISLRDRMKKPSIFGLSDSGHIFGTDYMGRDVFIRMWYATRTSLLVSFSGLVISILLGTALGIAAGLHSGRVDDIIMFLINVRISIPAIVIGIVVATIFGSGQTVMIVLIGCIYWTNFARLVRGEILRIKTENFIECSRAIGASSIRILFEHIIVNIASPLIVTATLNFSIILFENTLSYLGLGIVPPNTSLGIMVSSGREQMVGNAWLCIIPIIMIVIIVMSVSLIGDWLRDKLDPKLQKHS